MDNTMNWYVVRVVLHDATHWTEYSNLHEWMQGVGFGRMLVDDATGAPYHMPWAEYFISTLASAEEVLQLAEAQAAKTGRRHGVMVTRTTFITWRGLDLVVAQSKVG